MAVTSPRLGARMALAAIGVLGLAVVAAQLVFYFARTVDDAFISLRYAENLAAGDGFVYNPGERVEGTSSPLWVVLQLAGVAAGVNGVWVTKLLSLASSALLGCLAWATARRLGAGRRLAALGLVALAACSYVSAWALLGLETPLFLALLLAWPLALRGQLRAPSVGRAALAWLVALALATSRPEGPLWVATLGVATVASCDPRVGLRQRVWRAAGVGAATLCCAGALFALRRWYFGLWLPHTYYAKQGTGVSLEKLEALWGQGVHATELTVLGAAALVAVVRLVRLGDLVPAAYVATALVFVASVLEDWMPNQRHLLPLWVLAPLLVVGAVGVALRRATRAPWTAAGVALLVPLIWAGVVQLQTDSRFSPREAATHGRPPDRWRRWKTAETWRDAWELLRHRRPRHVERMHVDRMGMITQLWWVLEASTEPERESWFVGRDIGRVGWLSPVRVFDTDGLFTPAVVADEAWRRTGRVTPALAGRALALQPIATDLLDDWPNGAARVDLAGYDMLLGSKRFPNAMRRKGPRPPLDEVVARYRRVAAKLPRGFHLATLYGEGVGAAIERRIEHIEDRAARRPPAR
ncbi:MAG: hypothetical protein IT376_10970 [Polyangiaceae bacterium]|nr:hypothetical protein [Polyangiaceae bacterium]